MNNTEKTKAVVEPTAIETVDAKKAKKKKSPLKIAGDVFEWTAIGFLAVVLIFILVFASNKPGADGKSSGSLFGFETRLVLSDSMNAEKSFYDDKNYSIQSIAAGDVVFIKDCNYDSEQDKAGFYSSLYPGDIVTYYSSRHSVYITHRITAVEEKETKEGTDYIYTIQGDNVESSEYAIEKVAASDNLVVGKVVGKSTFVGWVYTHMLANRRLLLLFILIPCGIGIVFESARIIMIVSEEKKAKQKIVDAAKQSEIDELKAKLAALEQLTKGEKKEDEHNE